MNEQRGPRPARTGGRKWSVLPVLTSVTVVAAMLTAGLARAETIIEVTTTVDTLDPDGFCSLREAVLSANNDASAFGTCEAGSGPDTIEIPGGTYLLEIGGTGEDAAATGDLDLTDDLTINGAATTVVDGGGIDRVFHVVGGLVEISDVTIQNGGDGNAVCEGAGLYNSGGTVTINTSTISGNDGGAGGGLTNGGGRTMTLNSVTVSGNTSAKRGGGIENNGTLTVNTSTISGNSSGTTDSASDPPCPGTASFGGGGFFNDGTLTVNDSTISANITPIPGFFPFTGTSGGGIHNDSGSVTINRSTLSGNTARDRGGGIVNFSGGTVTLQNSTLSANSAVQNGGGIYLFDGTVTVTNSTISGNSSQAEGTDGLHKAPGGTLNLGSSILDNGGEDCSGSPTSQGYNLESGTSCGLTGTGDDQNADPLLGPLQNNGGPTETHALATGSPAMDSGDPMCPPPATDQRGTTRPQGAGCDIGAYEYEPAEAIIHVTTTVDTLDADGFCSLREAVLSANNDASFGTCEAGSEADTIEIPGGTYLLEIGGTGEDAARTGDLDLTDDLITINGAATTVVDGGGIDRVFHVVGGLVEISDVTIQNGGDGNAVCEGAGLYNSGGTVIINTSTISGNYGGAGGGLTNGGGRTMTLSSVTVSGNTSTKRGGGIENNGTLTVNTSTISGNSSLMTGSASDPPCPGTGFFGGGGFFNDGTLTVNDSTISGNITPIPDFFFTGTSGGGIHNDSGSVTINRSTLSGNNAGDRGGGIVNFSGGTVMLQNSTLSGNSAVQNGGGIYLFDGTVTVTNSTIKGNSSQNGIDGLHKEVGGTLNLGSSILDNGNGSGDCFGSPTSQGYNLERGTSCGLTGTGDDQNTDPMLGPLQNNGGPTETHAPMMAGGSPVVDSGDPMCPPPATDQRGTTRPQMSGCDKGAIEYVPAADLVLFKTDPPGRAPTGRNLTYTLTVLNDTGPDNASGVTVVDQLPPSVTFVQATPSQGTCAQSAGIVTCTLGTVGGSSVATIDIVVKPTVPGTITNTASVSASTADPNEGNNTDTETTTVCRITSRKSSIPCP